MKRNYAVTAVFVAVVLVLIGAMALGFLSGGGSATAQEPPYVLDHFKGYKIKTDTNQPPAANPFVVLQDQFDRRLQKWELKKVGTADMFFNPVEKTVVTASGTEINTPIKDERNHLTRFPIASIADMPAETTRWNVQVQNQFGKMQKLLVGPATYILVPTEKNPVAGQSDNFPDNLDHFKWYPAIRGKPVNIKVTLDDQWGTWEDVMVLTPVAFANPVRKIHLLSSAAAGGDINISEIQHPEAHLVAYKLEGPQSSSDPITAIINNQFVQTQNIAVLEGNLLLVPSAKRAFAPIRTPLRPPNIPPTD
ncbi:hypothetical protein ACFLVN_05280 [Chloroflexota bacterium]